MNRIFKFRVWNIAEQKWNISARILDIFERSGELCSCYDPKDNYVIQQMTGTLDSKGFEIFEGDILFSDNRTMNKYCSVIFDKGSFMVNDAGLERLLVEFLKYNVSEIVGNIFESKDLLEK